MKRHLLSCFFLFCYAGAIAHSLVPHHHHTTEQEAKEHHHSQHSGHTHDHHSEQDHSHKGSAADTFLYSHTGNADALINHGSIDLATKASKIVFDSPTILSIYEHAFIVVSVFHPPQSKVILTQHILTSFSRRGPPVV